jgi:mannitol-specific phosphotransferase system IIBC component
MYDMIIAVLIANLISLAVLSLILAFSVHKISNLLKKRDLEADAQLEEEIERWTKKN